MSSQKQKVRRRARIAVFFLLLLAGIYLAVSGYVAGVIFHTVRKPLTTDPSQYGLAYEKVEFTSQGDNTYLNGWFMHPPLTQAARPNQTIMMLHGSNSNKGNFIIMEVARTLVLHNYNVFSFDFRGNGESAGEMTSLGQWEVQDLAGALKYLKARDISRVGVIGYSMGAATSLNAAPGHPEIVAIVSDSAFANLSTIVDIEGKKTNALSPLFNPGIALMSKLLFGIDIAQNRPETAISLLGDRPIILIHSTGDDLVPLSEAVALRRAGAHDANLELWVAQGKGHVSAFADNKEEYMRRVLAFFSRWLVP